MPFLFLWAFLEPCSLAKIPRVLGFGFGFEAHGHNHQHSDQRGG